MPPQAHTPALWIRRLPEGVQGASGKPPACIDKRQLCRKQFPLAGPDAPIPARGKGLQPYGALYCSGGDPKGPGASGKPPVRPQAQSPAPGGDWRADSGADRDLPSQGALTLFFRWRKKSVQKKASGTATPEAARPASHCGQALRYACAWLRASWPSAISGASRPSASLGGGLRSAVAERLDAPNLFGASNSGP